MIDDQDAKSVAEQHADSASRPFNPTGGEDEGSASHDGDDTHLHDDQKPVGHAGDVDSDDPHKVEKLTKAGRDLDPDEGAD